MAPEGLHTLLDDHLAVRVGHRRRQVDLQWAERLQQCRQSVGGDDLRGIDRQSDGDLRFAVQPFGSAGLQRQVEREPCLAAG